MKSNYEILKIAAGIAGIRYDEKRSIPVVGCSWWGLWLHYDDEPPEGAPRYWNPLRKSDQALRLAAVTKTPIWFDGSAVLAGYQSQRWRSWRVEIAANDLGGEDALRRAIVLAVVEGVKT